MKKISNFAERLKVAMDLKGLRAVNLSENLKIDKSLLSRYLSGKAVPKQDKLDEISKFLGISYAWLLGYYVEMNAADSISNKIIELLKRCNDVQLSKIFIYANNVLNGEKHD